VNYRTFINAPTASVPVPQVKLRTRTCCGHDIALVTTHLGYTKMRFEQKDRARKELR